MKRVITLLALVAGLTATAQTNTAIRPPAPLSAAAVEALRNTNFTYTVISAPNNTWGYNVLREGKLYIHQPSIPGLAGNEGFKTKETAAKVAELVIGKMKKGEMPPTVTEEELKSLKAL